MAPNVETTSSHTALTTAAGYRIWVCKPNTRELQYITNRINEILRNLQERKAEDLNYQNNLEPVQRQECGQPA